MKNLLKKLFVCGYWDIVVSKSVDDLKNNKVVLLKSSLFEWHADPFVLVESGTIHLFCERKRISKKNGDICLYLISNKAKKKGVLIKEPFHLSFPNLIEKEKSCYYIIPESSRGNSLKLYSYNPTTFQASFVKNIMLNCSLVDSVVWNDNGSFHIFSYDTRGFLVDYLLADDFSIQEMNRFEDRDYSMRPAGNPVDNIFFFQKCSSVYGQSIIAKAYKNNEFETVTDDYIELISNYCKNHKYHRFHTFNKDNKTGVFVFDAYKEKINLLKPLLFFWRFFNGNH